MKTTHEHDALACGDVWSALDERFRVFEARHARRSRRAFAAGAVLASLLVAAGAAVSQVGAEALFIDAAGRVGIGTRTPLAQLDLQQEPRTSVDSHSKTAKVMYVTGALAPDAGIEFRLTDGSQGIGFGHNTIYATGNNAKQDLRLRARGGGDVVVADGAIVGMGTVPQRAILMWSGEPAQVPTGWALCDGTRGTPDLRSRFVVGYDARDPQYNKVNATGGQAGVPPGDHTHHVTPLGLAVGIAFGPQLPSDAQYSLGYLKVYGPNTGGVEQPAAQENRPPYLVLAYVMYVGPAN